MQLEATTQTCCKKATGTGVGGVGEVGAEREAAGKGERNFPQKQSQEKPANNFFSSRLIGPNARLVRRRRSVVVALVRPGTELRLCNCGSDWGLAKQGLATFWGIQQQMPNGKLAKTFERVEPPAPTLLDASLLWPVL